MRLEPLYRLRFQYTDGWSVAIAPDGTESENFFLADGRVEGAITGRFRGANSPHGRSDGTYLPEMRAVVETDDGGTILVRLAGYGRAYPQDRRQVVGTATHLSEHEAYRRLNDVVCVLIGEVRRVDDDSAELVVDVAELVWEPLGD